MSEKKYLLPEDSPYIQQYEQILETISRDKRGLTINVDPDVIKQGSIDIMALLIASAQHRNEWINALIFGITFHFVKEKDTETFYAPEEWVNDPEYLSWLAKMGTSVPMSLFFIRDWPVRFYTITGDLINEGKVNIEENEEEKEAQLSFNEEDMNTMQQRVGNGCVMFMDYCNGTGVDPQPFIEKIISEFQVGFDYEEVMNQYLDGINSGAQYRLNFNS